MKKLRFGLVALLVFCVFLPTPGRALPIIALDETVYCDGDGTSGKRIILVYVYPSGTTNDYTLNQGTMGGVGDWLDDTWFSVSGNRQHPRFSCYSDTKKPRIIIYQGPAIGTDNNITFTEIKTAFANSGNTSTNRIYLMLVDNVVCCYPYGGQGTIDHDDRPDASNPNNTGPAYAMIDVDQFGWSASKLGRAMFHEFGHTLGAVQCSAPHSSCPAGELGNHHCYDEADVMCYDDDGSYFNGPDGIPNNADDRPLWNRCAQEQWDCGTDDYYKYAPTAGSYLATHWNTARSSFIWPNT